MEKIIRKAVRTYLIEDNKVIVIKYKEHDQGYYDIPGGKIEEGENSSETSIREFREETGIDILKQHKIGRNVLEFPQKIYDFDVYLVDEYNGLPQDFLENESMWIDIDTLYLEDKIFPSIKAIKYLKDGMNLKMICESNDVVSKIIEL